MTLLSNRPQSSEPPVNSETDNATTRAIIVEKKIINPRNLPNTISITEMGADTRKVSVWLRRSSAIRRAVKRGVIINSTTAAMANNGTIIISVSPGGLAIFINCGCACKKIFRCVRKTQVSTDCTIARVTHASGELNSIFNSFRAIVSIRSRAGRVFGIHGMAYEYFLQACFLLFQLAYGIGEYQAAF